MLAGVTLSGMLIADPTLFDGVTVPEGLSLDTLVDTIVFSYGDLYLTNTNTAWTKAAITVWWLRHQYYLEELYKTLSYEYNPIENYDRYEEYTDTSEESGSRSGTGQVTGTESGTSGATTSTTSSSTSQRDISAYNASTFQPDAQNTDSGTTSGQDSGTHSGTSETNSTDSETTSSSGTLTHEAHIHGNIGVTTAAQMIQGQREIIRISWYDEAAALFASEFCLMVY